jgi:hypothetical protein
MGKLDQALDKITVRLLDSLREGEDYFLTDMFTLYKYADGSGNIVVALDTEDDYVEIVQVLYDDRSMDFEVLDNYLYNQYT